MKRTIQRLLRSYAITLAATVPILLHVVPASAQDSAEPDLLSDSFEACSLIADDHATAVSYLGEHEWQIDRSEAYGPSLWEIGATREYVDGTDVTLFAVTETYPIGQITFCSFDALYVRNPPDLRTFAAPGLVGDVIVQNRVNHGTWGSSSESRSTFILADQSIDYFYFQMTAVSPGR